MFGSDVTDKLHIGSYNGSSTESDHLVITRSSGNVGIGTTSPHSKLHVNGNITLDACRTGSSYPTGSVGGGISFREGAAYAPDSSTGAYNCSILTYAHDQSTDGLSINGYDGVSFCTGSSTRNEQMRINSSGKVGIGTTDPKGGLHVANYYNHGTTQVGNRFLNENSYNHASSSWMHAANTNGRIYVGIRCNNGIWCAQLNYDSDSRIKIDITDLSDNRALELVRNIPCREYHYKDITKRKREKTIGFIAQEVNEILPSAVLIEQNIIPNEMRILTNISWEEITDNSFKYKLTTDLSDCSGVKYRFYVSNDLSGNDETMKEVVGNSDNTFTFEEKWNNVFCYGKEIDDFHALDKAKLFALNFSATQELDRKVIALESENAELKAELAAIKQHLGI
jgi:hypothetical protein